MSTDVVSTIDEARVEEFAGRLLGLYTSGLLAYMIDIGNRTGLFAAATDGRAGCGELAGRAGLQERYVREWLGAMVTGGIFDYDPATRTYDLPAEHAACLAGEGAWNVAPLSQINAHLGKHLHQVGRAFREGGGVPYAEFRPEFTDVMDAMSRGTFDNFLVDEFLPLASGLSERLTAGVRVADIGCGTGHAIVLLAQAFPASEFIGYDLAEDAVAAARAEAAEAGLINARFEVCDVAGLTIEQPFDVVFVFDAIHDQVDPAGVLARIHDALAPGGLFFMFEPRAASNLEDNIGNPLAPWLYAVSTLHCMTVSLAQGGAGLGTAWGEELARRMLAEAGFADVVVHEAPGDPFNSVYVTHRPEI